MENSEIGFYSFKQFGYFSLHIEVIEIQLKHFVSFLCTWRIKLLNTSKSKAFFR